MKLFILIMFTLILAADLFDAVAFESIRSQEINQCLSGEIVTWGDGKDRSAVASELKFVYDHAGAPEWFAESQVAAMVAKAAAEWSQCGIRVVMIDRVGVWDQLKGVVIKVQWSAKESRGNFGLANQGMRTLSLGPGPFALLKARNPKHDARETLQLVISHEMGHFLGLMAHSRRCVDVLSYYDNGKGEKCYSRDVSQMKLYKEYRYLLPTACDIERCRMINGKPPLPDGKLPERSQAK